jgi:hypothetical protein
VGRQGQWKNPRRTKVEGIMINGLLFWLILLLVFYVALYLGRALYEVIGLHCPNL